MCISGNSHNEMVKVKQTCLLNIMALGSGSKNYPEASVFLKSHYRLFNWRSLTQYLAQYPSNVEYSIDSTLMYLQAFKHCPWKIQCASQQASEVTSNLPSSDLLAESSRSTACILSSKDILSSLSFCSVSLDCSIRYLCLADGERNETLS